MQRAGTVLVMGDGGHWIDPPNKRECFYDRRIVDYYPAVEHLYEAVRAVLGKDTPEARAPANNVGHFTNHRGHMDYPTYRRKGWSIGSGVTESAVNLFNKRVKGTESAGGGEHLGRGVHPVAAGLVAIPG